MNEIKERKNKEMDRVMPLDKYHGRGRFFDFAMRFRGKFADLLEAFSSKAFLLGVKIGRFGRDVETDKFNPVTFEQLCNDKFVGEQFMDAIRYIEDPEYRKEVDAKKFLKG